MKGCGWSTNSWNLSSYTFECIIYVTAVKTRARFSYSPAQMWLLTSGHHWTPVQICSLEDPPLVLTSSGGHWNTYGWQVGGTHPIGMLSCFLDKYIFISLRFNWTVSFNPGGCLCSWYKVIRYCNTSIEDREIYTCQCSQHKVKWLVYYIQWYVCRCSQHKSIHSMDSNKNIRFTWINGLNYNKIQNNTLN